MQPNHDRLRIATRIHFALLRQYGTDVHVDTLLKGGDEAREALWVCEASDDAELRRLARQLHRAASAEAAPSPTPAPQDAVWANQTSGFGVTAPIGLDPLPEPRPSAAAGWLRPTAWMRRSALPKPH